MKYFFIMGKDNCPYCEEAKNIIINLGHVPVYINLSENPEWRLPEWKKLPQIFHEGEHIGGCTALIHWLGLS